MTTFLLELKTRWLSFFDSHKKLIMFFFKLGMAMTALFLLTHEIGYVSILKNPLITVPSAVVCGLTPAPVTVFVISFFVIAHLFSVSVRLAIVVLLVFAIMYLLFFRICPKAVYVLLITCFCFFLHIEYVLPVVFGLFLPIGYIFAVNFGIITYYILHTIGTYEATLTRQSGINLQAVSFIAESIFRNHSLYAVLIAFTITFLLVNIVKRASFNYAKIYAIIAGVVSEIVILVVADIWLSAGLSLAAIIAGTLVGTFIALILNAVIFPLDYTRAEHVQFEDDEYYYYVKVVPKRKVAASEVKVTTINARDVKEMATMEFTPVDIADNKDTDDDKDS